MFANFYGHFWSSLPLKRFLDNEFPSEAHVITRLAYNAEHGMDAGMREKGGFMLYTEAVRPLYKAVDQEPYRDAAARLLENEDGISVYLSHIGFQDDVLYPVWAGLFKVRDIVLEKAREGSRWQERMTHYGLYYVVQGTQGFVALLNALAIAFVLLWVKREFSASAAYIALGLTCALLADLTFFGRSMWWMMAIWFMPFIISAFALQANGGRPLAAWALGCVSILAGGFLSLKTSMGYEFTSTIMVAGVIPFAYYAVRHHWPLWTWVQQCLPVGLCLVAGLAATLYWHYEVLSAAGHDPLEVLRQRFEMRSHGGEVFGEPGGALGRSVDSSLLGVWAGYIFAYKNMGLPQIILMMPLLGWLWTRRGAWRSGFTEDDQLRGLLAAIALGFSGALSMFTILKGHAYIHSFDTVAWSIPMNLMLMAFYGRLISQKLS